MFSMNRAESVHSEGPENRRINLKTQHANPQYAPQLNISQKALGTLPEYGNVMPKHVEATIYN
jgi:hypothetical protein